LFGETSWIQVMIGQGLMPKHYHQIVDMMSDTELKGFLANIKSTIARRVNSFPEHNEFIKNYCKSMVV